MSEAEISAFRHAMLQRRPEVLARLAEVNADALPFETGEGSEALGSEMETSFGMWLDAAEGPGQGALEAWALGLGEKARERGVEARKVLMQVERTGGRILDAALDAVEEGIAGAEEGAQGIIRAMNAATTALDRAFRAKAEVAAQRARVLRAVAENAPDGIGIAGADGSVVYANPAFQALMGSEAAARGHFTDFVHPDERHKLAHMAEVSQRTGRYEGNLRYLRADGTTFTARITSFRVYTENDELLARCVLLRDATAEEQAAEERRALEEEMQRAQAAALQELSAPLLPLAEGVLAMPLVGSMDNTRTSRMIEVMLEGITRTGAGHVIVDITGVPVVDAEVAESLVRAAKAAELVGAKVVLTGVRGAVAKTFLELEVDLGGMQTWSTLRAGVAHAIGHERQKRKKRAGAR